MSEGHGDNSKMALLEKREPLSVRSVAMCGAVLMGTTVTLTFVQVVLRTVFEAPQTWLEEVSRYIFVWVVFLGAALAFFRDNHVRLDIVDFLIKGRAAILVWRLRIVAELLAAGLLLYSGILVAWRNRNSAFYSLPDMPQVVFYLSVPVCSVLIIWFLYYRARRGPATPGVEVAYMTPKDL